jgi:site-specific recombinase XerD
MDSDNDDRTADTPTSEQGGCAPVSHVPGTVILRSGKLLDIRGGDFRIEQPGNLCAWIKLSSRLPLYPFQSSAGKPFTHYILRQLETRSPHLAEGNYKAQRAFCKYLMDIEGFKPTHFTWAKVNEQILMRYYSDLKSRSLGYEFNRIRHFYKWAVDAGYEGFDPDLADKLALLRIKGNPKGVAVLTGDPERGPLPDLAFQQVVAALDREDIPIRLRVCMALTVELGANPAQFCELLLRDLHVFTKGTTTIYQIDLPRSKKRDSLDQRKRRPISGQLGKLLEKYVLCVHEGATLPCPADKSLLHSSTRTPLTAQEFTKALGEYADRVQILAQGSVGARRMRRTFITRLVEHGASEETVMELADHTDRQNIDPYFEMRGGAVEHIDKAVGATLEPLVRRFMGEVVDNEASAELGDCPAQRVRAAVPLGDIAIGTCKRDLRTEGICEKSPPYSCYLCPLFQPWRDADHQEVARSLEEKRAQLVDPEGEIGSNPVVSKLDILIAAIKEAATLCAAPDATTLPSGRRKRRKES